MANTCTQIYIHVVVAVEGRRNLIAPKHNDEWQRYMTGIVSGQRQKLDQRGNPGGPLSARPPNALTFMNRPFFIAPGGGPAKIPGVVFIL